MHLDDACQFFILHTAGDGSSSSADESSTASELCEAEKQQRAQKCDQCNATPVPGSRDCENLSLRYDLEKRPRSVLF